MRKRNPFDAFLSLGLAEAFSPAVSSGATGPGFPGVGRLLSEGSEGEKRTVRARRRRRTEPAGPEGRERAEAPRRRRPEGEAAAPSAPRPPSGAADLEPGYKPPAAGPLPSLGPLLGAGGCSSRTMLILGALALVALCILLFIVFGGRDSGEVGYVPPTPTFESFAPSAPEAPTATSPSFEGFEVESPTEAPGVFQPPSAVTEGQTWTVMLYQDADDKVLEQDIYVDLNEAERVGSSDRVHVVAQVDRYNGGFQGDGNWTSTKRFYLTADPDLQRVRSQQVADLGELNMSDGNTLVDFVTWGVETFPADKYVLILSDHGMGWPGGWSDPDPRVRADSRTPLSSRLGNLMYLMDLDEALQEVRDRAGIEQFEMVGMDACLMGHLEVLSALAPHARYAVTSQETEPALGWAYTGFLEALKANPDMDGAELGQLIVDSYIEEDQRIVDDQARAELLRQGSPMGGLLGMLGGMSASQLAQQMEQSITLTAVDLAGVPDLLGSVNDLAYILQGANQKVVAQARSYAQSFTSIFGRDVPPSYIDLGHFVQLLKNESNSREVAQAADGVLASLNRAVIAEKHGPKKPGATGVSLYFPNSQLYRSSVAGPESYVPIAGRFAEASAWDDFLAYHYTGRSFEPSTTTLAVPERGAAISAPGAGRIEVSPITLSTDVAAPGRPVILSTDIRGENIGYVRLFVGFYDQDANSILVADMDYLESDDTREIDGVYYPDWGEGEFTMEFEWEPVVFAVDDGVDSVVALFTPESYGATFEEAVYTVEGLYTYGDDGESRHARLYFSDGLLRHVYGFTGEDATGAPREIFPQAGDTFTVLEQWMDLDERGKVVQKATQEGDTLTFGDRMFAWKDLDAAPGQYVVGFLVEDLDGNLVEVFDRVTVE